MIGIRGASRAAIVCCLLSHLAAAAEPPPLLVQLYPSVVTGVKPSRALGATRPMVELLSSRLNYPIELSIVTDKKDANLNTFSRKLAEGDVHIGVMWGIEFGWVNHLYPNLEILAATTREKGQVGWPSQLMVSRTFPGQNIGALRGKKLAVIDRAPLMDALFLAREIESANFDPDGFFVSEQVFDTVSEAIRAVQNGTCDCVVLNIAMWDRYLANKPAAANHLNALATSPTKFPDALLAGDRVRVNKLRSRLWEDVQAELQKMDRDAEGEQCLNFWRIEKFVSPDYGDFREIIRQSAATYPFERALRPIQFAR